MDDAALLQKFTSDGIRRLQTEADELRREVLVLKEQLAKARDARQDLLARVRIAEAKKALADAKDAVGEARQYGKTAIAHYRNLAILLGAKPDQMLNLWDRVLAETKATTDEHVENTSDVWDEVIRLRDEHAEALRKLDYANHDGAKCATECRGLQLTIAGYRKARDDWTTKEVLARDLLERIWTESAIDLSPATCALVHDYLVKAGE